MPIQARVSAHQHVDPRRQRDDQHQDVAHAIGTAGDEVGDRIAQEDADDRRLKGDHQRTPQDEQKVMVGKESDKVIQRKGEVDDPVAAVGECVKQDQQHRQQDHQSDPDHIRGRQL